METPRRSKYEIIAKVLENCIQPRTKTGVMYKSRLSFWQAEFYLSELLSENYLAKYGQKYTITDKGRKFLAAYHQMERILEQTPIVP